MGPEGEIRLSIRMATDIGGTFTDLVYLDENTGAIGLAKVPTRPGQLEQGILEAVTHSGVDAASIKQFVHGTTLVINTITERKGASVGLLTTRGMRDVLEIGRGNRPDIYNLLYEKPQPFVPRSLRLEVQERMSASGEVLGAICDDDVRVAAAAFRDARVDAVAICFLHAYANPDHEIRAAEIIREELPASFVSVSSEITREFREYERTNTAVMNSYVGPVTAQYLDILSESLVERQIDAHLHIMQSNGGSATFAAAQRVPINLVESGPVGGVIGAAGLGKLMGIDNIITLDIGGTTAKTSLIAGGEVNVTTDYKLEWTPLWAGYPIKVPVVDIVEIGAGGGSIASVDESRVLRVGPRSAGAEPGPAAYDQGGTEPTVTDANLIAGRYDPDFFLGGQMKLSLDHARRSFLPLAERFDISIEHAALGVIRVTNANMMNALKIVSIQRGFDPREFTLFALGGGGAVHSAFLARELQIGQVVVPVAPGHFSAFGMLTTDLRRDYIRTHVCRTDQTDPADITRPLSEMETTGFAAYHAEGFTDEELMSVRAADMRYRGQEHTVRVPVPGGQLGARDLATIEDRFHSAHEQQYTFRLDSAIEIVNLHVTVFGTVITPPPAMIPEHNGGGVKGTRVVDFDDEGRHETTIYDRNKLGANAQVTGPAIIEEAASNTVVYPEMTARVDHYGNLIIDTGLERNGYGH
jgi:N-methylhydantoinase A